MLIMICAMPTSDIMIAPIPSQGRPKSGQRLNPPVSIIDPNTATKITGVSSAIFASGARSSERSVAKAMTERGPRARLVEFAGVGHAPMLVQPDQVHAVREFLLGP